jgi:glutamate--cysteine ligase
MDLNPFESIGINADTARLLDLFLLHCALTDSAPDTPAEIAAMQRNQQTTAARGREPGVCLERDGAPVALTDWARELLSAFEPIAQAVDGAVGGDAYACSLTEAQACVAHPERLPSARVLVAIRGEYHDSYLDFVRARAEAARADLVARPFAEKTRARFSREAAESLAKQRQMEAADRHVPFETYRRAYMSPACLRLP